MMLRTRSSRSRAVRPVLLSLEGRTLLNAAAPHHVHDVRVSAHVALANQNKGHGPSVTVLNKVSSNGFQFTNFDGPDQGTNPGTGTNMNGISNGGTAVGFTIDNNGHFNNFAANPLRSKAAAALNINGSTTAMALGINSAGTVVGSDGNGNAFYLSHGKVKTFIPTGGSSATAFGSNDHGTIVGQFVASAATPGFIRVNSHSFITINAPSGPDTVNAQGINNHGLVVGFYVGTDTQFHGFMASEKAEINGILTGTAIADPSIPVVASEPSGTTFVFSQILGINDHGIAVGYYGDSTGSQHGFLYNTNTGIYTFLDDPSEAFNGAVEVTQITGITNSGEITGFYTDADGVAHGFVATTQRG
jgi:hypothetical protein